MMYKFSTEKKKVEFLNKNLDKMEIIIESGKIPSDAKDRLLDDIKNIKDSNLLLISKRELTERINNLIATIEG